MHKNTQRARVFNWLQLPAFINSIFLCLIFYFISTTAHGQGNKEVLTTQKNSVQLFSLADLRLLDGQFKNIMDLDHQYLLTLDPDRLTSWFRREAGLTPKAQPYPYWESEDVWGKGPLAGHIMGFYLSSMSMMFQSTGDSAIISRLNYTLDELDLCQTAQKDGYLLATINGRQVFKDVTDNKFTTSNPLINDSWEPVYIMNKIMLGLNGIYTRCGLSKAKTIFIRMADWFGDSVLNKLSHEQIQKLLVCEHGSINESYIDAYKLTGDKKYLNWAIKLNDEDMWVPLSQRKDILNGWHANTQIPKFTGFENVYNFTGEKKYTDAAQFFWTTVVNKHTWSIGGNSTGEHFFSENEFENRLPLTGGPESCNSVNMLRLTEILYKDYGETEKIDYYERVLFNHILASYDPDSAMCVYYTSMRPGHYKVYGTRYHSFWCCTGTGLESPAKFAQMIYSYDSSSLNINLFIPSSVNWKEKQMMIVQQTSFPDEGQTLFTISAAKPVKLTIRIRHPKWLDTKSSSIKVNGKNLTLQKANNGYVEITRIWKTGDEISMKVNGKISLENIPGGNKYFSVLYGPVIMAAQIDNAGLTEADFRNPTVTVARKEISMSAVPSFTGNSPEILTRITKEKTKEISLSITDPVSGNSTQLIPFNRIHFNRYAVYFRHYENKDQFQAAVKREKEMDQYELFLTQATVDSVIIGNSEDEKAHRFEAVQSASGGYGRQSWRHATQGGYFMYQFNLLPNTDQQLYFVTQSSLDSNRVYDIYANGEWLATIDHSKNSASKEDKFIGRTIPIPEKLTRDGKQVTIKIQAKRNKTAGGIFDLRIVRNNAGYDFNKYLVEKL